jgi:hypothetical protein
VTGCFFYISRSSLTLFHLFLYTFYYSAVMTFNPARKQAYGSHKEAARAAACRDFFDEYLFDGVCAYGPAVCSYCLHEETEF